MGRFTPSHHLPLTMTPTVINYSVAFFIKCCLLCNSTMCFICYRVLEVATRMARLNNRYYEIQKNCKVLDELGIDMVDLPAVDSVGRGVVRKHIDLTVEERQYLLAVERGDIPTVQQWLARTKASCPIISITFYFS